MGKPIVEQDGLVWLPEKVRTAEVLPSQHSEGIRYCQYVSRKFRLGDHHEKLFASHAWSFPKPHIRRGSGYSLHSLRSTYNSGPVLPELLTKKRNAPLFSSTVKGFVEMNYDCTLEYRGCCLSTENVISNCLFYNNNTGSDIGNVVDEI
jgi:hypothetical protein